MNKTKLTKQQIINNMIIIFGECDPENVDDFIRCILNTFSKDEILTIDKRKFDGDASKYLHT